MQANFNLHSRSGQVRLFWLVAFGLSSLMMILVNSGDCLGMECAVVLCTCGSIKKNLLDTGHNQAKASVRCGAGRPGVDRLGLSFKRCSPTLIVTVRFLGF